MVDVGQKGRRRVKGAKRKVITGAIVLVAGSQAAVAEDLRLCLKAWNWSQAGEHAAALELFDQCIKEGGLTTNSLARTYRNIGITLRRHKQPARAVEEYGKAIALQPADVWDDFVNRGNAYSDQGLFHEALADYRRALDARPNYNEAYYNRGIVFERQERMEDAKREFLKAHELGLRSDLLYERLVMHGLVERKQ